MTALNLWIIGRGKKVEMENKQKETYKSKGKGEKEGADTNDGVGIYRMWILLEANTFSVLEIPA